MFKVLPVSFAALMILALTGCYYTRIATPQKSSDEEAWEGLIRESYSGYEPPPTIIRRKGKTQPVAPLADSAELKAHDDTAAEKKEAEKPVALPVDEPQKKDAEVKPAEKPAEAPAKAEAEKPAEAPAKAEAEKPAEAPAKAEAEKPAEAPAKAEAEKPADTAAAPAPTGINPPDPTNSTVYEVKSGDTLGSIAQKNYGNARFSNVIFKANADILKNPNRLRPGMKLILPKL